MPIEAILPPIDGEGWGKSRDVHDEMLDRASAVMGTLRTLIPWAAYTLTGWDVGSGSHLHKTLTSDGYTDDVLAHVNDAYVENNPAFDVLHRVPRALRWSDLRRDWNIDFPETKTAQEFLIPAGFREGTTLCLRLPDGRYTGSLCVSWSSPHDPTNETLEIMQGFKPLLALVCDLFRSAQHRLETLGPDAHAVLVSVDGRVTELPGRAPGLALGEGGMVRCLLLTQRITLGGARYLWADAAGRCHRIETIPCHGGTTMVTDRTIQWPFGLTVREAQILQLVTLGLSNSDIARKLYISPRTVSTHVEHLLEKLDCLSRAQLAVIAVKADILLLE